ncbi:MAG TPA: hypothetical protein VJT74_09440, partial [Pyrinomonadaceae bacterium]|nr:hypothetical protein [Pyrinomonadaceae bacterium]
LKKEERCWIVQDTLSGEGEHLFHFRFHLNEGLETQVRAQGIVSACDKMTGARLFVCALDLEEAPSFEPRYVARDYGAKSASLSVCWTVKAHAPRTFHWALVPVCASDDEAARLALVERLKNYEALIV